MALAETAPLRASPGGVRWERPRNPGLSREEGIDRGARRVPSGVRAGPSLAHDGLHPVLRDELELLELADPPLLVRREGPAGGEPRQLLFIFLVLLPQLPA